MEHTSDIDLELAKKLADTRYRREFFRLRTQDDIAGQIHAFREMRDLTQTALANRCGMKQSAISRIEQADYKSWTLNTLLRVAEALDAHVRVILEPAEAVVERLARLQGDNALKAINPNPVGSAGTNYIPFRDSTTMHATPFPSSVIKYESIGTAGHG